MLGTCPFCAIAQKQAPALITGEDAACLAFIPLEVEAYGHTIVIPRLHFDTLTKIPADLLAQAICFCRELALEYQAKLPCDGFNILLASGASAQQSVPHLHFHLIPRGDGDGLDAWPHLSDQAIDRKQMHRDMMSRLRPGDVLPPNC